MKKLGMIICAVAIVTTISYAQQTDSTNVRSGSTGINDVGTKNGTLNQSTTPQSIQQTPAQSTPTTPDPTSPVGEPLPQPQWQSQPKLQSQPSLQTQPEIESQPELQVQPAQPQVPTQRQPVPNNRELQDLYNDSVQPASPSSTNPAGSGTKP